MTMNVERNFDFLTFVRADLHRHYGRFGWLLLLRSVLFKRTFSPVFTLRLCQSLDTSGLLRIGLPFARLCHRWASARAAIDLPWRTQIGAGFRIIHGFGLVINEDARIGRNVTVFQGVTIGQRDRTTPSSREVDMPVVEDEAFIGAYAMVLGSTVGRGAVIAPLSVVVSDVEAQSAVSGNPAKVIKHDVQSYIAQPWREMDKDEDTAIHRGSTVFSLIADGTSLDRSTR